MNSVYRGDNVNPIEELIKEDLQSKQRLSINEKIEYSKCKIKEFVGEIGVDNCFISFSGGKDSTVLLHLIRSMYPNMKAVFFDTMLEYPEIYNFIDSVNNVEYIKPQINPLQVFKEHGLPSVSKEQALYVYEVRNSDSDKVINKRLNYPKSYSIFKRWIHLTDKEFVKYEISPKCCDYLKKNPSHDYIKKNKKYPFIGTRAEESLLRMNDWYKHSCNRFDSKIQSRPLSIWLDKDIEAYIKMYDIEICELYHKGHKRTGCYLCPFGVHIEDELYGTNKFELMKQNHPNHYKSLSKIGIIDVLLDMEVPIRNDSEYMDRFYERQLRIGRWYRRIGHEIKEDGLKSNYYKYYKYFK